MRGPDRQQFQMISYVSLEKRVPAEHPLRTLWALSDAVLQDLSPLFDQLYARTGRPSIAPEKLLRAILLQVLYSIRSEALLMEQLDYNLLFRWFVGLDVDDPVWDATVFSKNRSGCSTARWRPRSLSACAPWPRSTGCSPMSTSPSTARWCRRGRDRRASNAGTATRHRQPIPRAAE